MGKNDPEGTQAPAGGSEQKDKQDAVKWVAEITKNPEGSDAKPKKP